MTDNHNRKNVWDIKESPDSWFYPPMNHPRIKSKLTEKKQYWLKLLKKDPVMVIDLNTLKLRPPKYK